MLKPRKNQHGNGTPAKADHRYLYRRALRLVNEIRKLTEEIQKLEGGRRRFSG
jgi:hypothetical protein